MPDADDWKADGNHRVVHEHWFHATLRVCMQGEEWLWSITVQGRRGHRYELQMEDYADTPEAAKEGADGFLARLVPLLPKDTGPERLGLCWRCGHPVLPGDPPGHRTSWLHREHGRHADGLGPEAGDPMSRIEKAWQKVAERLESLNLRLPDARTSPMSSRFILADARDLIQEAAMLYVLHHPESGEKPWAWLADAPDHWCAVVDGTGVSMTVWSRTSGDWIWEVWDPDGPVREGTAATGEEAREAAERSLWKLDEFGGFGQPEQTTKRG